MKSINHIFKAALLVIIAGLSFQSVFSQTNCLITIDIRNCCDVCDPCNNPEVPFPIGVYVIPSNGIPAPLPTPVFPVTWTASDPDVLIGQNVNNSSIMAYSDVIYYLEATGPNGCIIRDTFFVECCPAPTNLACAERTIEGVTGTVLTWDPVPGATRYEVYLNTNDPRCCLGSTPSLGQSYMYSTTTNRQFVPFTSSNCISWSVKTICSWRRSSSMPPYVCSLRGSCNIKITQWGGDVGTLGTINGRLGPQSQAPLKVFPSPASDLLNIEGVDLTVGTQVNIIDMAGRVVYRSQTTTEGSQKLSVKDTPNGMYYIQLQNEGKITHTQKLMILH